MIRFIKAFWIALLASAAMFTSCIRLDAGSHRAAPAKQPAPAPAEVTAAQLP